MDSENIVLNSIEAQSHTKGFTLLEVMISITILVTITIFTMVNIKGGNELSKLRITRDRMISEIRKMQTYALAGRVCDAGISASCDGTQVPAYGFNYTCVTPSSCATVFKIFWDNCDIDPLIPECDQKLTNDSELLVNGENIVDIPKGSIIQAFVQSSASSNFLSVQKLDIVFQPFSSKVSIKGNGQGNYLKGKVKISNKNDDYVEFILDRETGAITQPDTVRAGITNSNSNTN